MRERPVASRATEMISATHMRLGSRGNRFSSGVAADSLEGRDTKAVRGVDDGGRRIELGV
jgi:hypothetical protein